jgi:ATP-dependent helicase/nuclease subunit A
MAARDPIEELLSSAMEFERGEVPSLDRFLAWFSRGNVEVKRDPSAPANAVRVMTVHGSKGLEAPFVIIADATADPAKLGGVSRTIDFPLPEVGVAPLIRPRKGERIPLFSALMERDEVRALQEHWRLLYVGLTRAVERLVVAGVQPARERVEDCWHMRVERALLSLGAAWESDARWGQVLRHCGSVPQKRVSPKAPRTGLQAFRPPEWSGRPAPAESRPPRPLTPSAITDEGGPSDPPSAAMRAAARRGTLIHQLFERLPEVAVELRHRVAIGWLQRSGGVQQAAEADEIASLVCRILTDPRFSDLFTSAALAEAPIAATLSDGRVLAGTVDRLLIRPDSVLVVDFKTGRAPRDAESIPLPHLLQMKAYADALRIIFPGRNVRAGLLYTSEAKLFEVAG